MAGTTGKSKAAKPSEAETAVRNYLLFVEDPNKLRDDKDVQAKTQAVLAAADPLEKLKALAELERAANIDEKPLREGFIANAKAWSEDQGIPLAAFREMRVTDDVLREAGFDVPASSRRRRNGGGSTRAKAVPVEDIKAFVLTITGTFVLSDVMDGIGGSQATVRKALDDLINGGEVVKLGAMPNYTGRGRAPLVYERKAA